MNPPASLASLTTLTRDQLIAIVLENQGSQRQGPIDGYAAMTHKRHMAAESKEESKAREMAKTNGLDPDLAAKLSTALLRVRRDGLAIEHVEAGLRIEKICLQAVMQNSTAISFLSDRERTTQVCLAAINRDARAFIHLNDSNRTPEFCLAAVQCNGDFVSDLTIRERTPEVCLAAVQQNLSSLDCLATHEITPDIAAFVADNFIDRKMLDRIPSSLWTQDIADRAVTRDPHSIAVLPGAMQTPERRMKAVLIGDDMTLSCIPVKMRTAELCHQAVLRSGFAIDHVPHKLRTQSLLTLAVDKDPQSIRHLDPSQRNSDVCWTAVNGDGLAIRYVPVELLTPELRMLALDQPDKGAAIRFLPEPTQEEILTALRNTNYKLGLISKGSLGVIQHIAPELRTPLVCKTALQYEHPNATRRMSADETKSGQEFEVNRLRAQFAAKPAQSEHVRESPV